MLQLIFFNGGGNLNSIRRKDVLKNLLLTSRPSILSITESNLHSCENPPDIDLENYNKYDFKKKRIVSYFRRDSGFKPIEIGCDLKIPIHVFEGRDVIVASIYSEFKRYSDDINYVDVDRQERLRLLTNAIKFVCGRAGSKAVIIGGDFNFDFKEQNNEEVKEYVKVLKLLGLEQTIKHITRPKKGKSLESGTIIDHILVKKFTGRTYTMAVGESDHKAVVFSMGDYSRIQSRPFEKVKKAVYDLEIFRWAYANYPFGRPDQKWDDLEEIVDQLEAYMGAVETLATKETFVKEGAGWWTPKLTRLQYESDKDPNNYPKYKIYKDEIKKAHRKWDNLQMQRKGHPYRNKEKTKITKLIVEDKTVTDKTDIAEALANHFDKKVSDIIDESDPDFEEIMKQYHDSNVERGINSWEIEPPTLEQVSDLIDSLPQKKSSGRDGLPYTLCKFLRDRIKEPIWRIFQLVFKEKRVLSKHKQVQVTGVYKKGNPELPSNYRPVGIGYLIMRLIEKWISIQLGVQCRRQPLLPREVHGFVKGKSCETCLINVRDYALQMKAKGKTVCMVFLDATAAFDTIPRDLILAGLKAIQCGPNTLEILRSYLQDEWTMQVKVGDNLSHRFVAKAGVIQGGGCSATLYGIATAVLEFLTRKVGKIFIYADDSVIVIASDSNDKAIVSEHVRKAIDTLLKVMVALGLTNNARKSEVLPLWECIVDEYFLVGDFKCKPSRCLKFLGCMLNRYLDQSDHVKEIVRKMQVAHFKLRNQKYNRSPEHVIQFIKSNIMSHIMYAVNYWLPASTQCDRDKLQEAQNKFVIPLLDNRDWSLKRMRRPNHAKLYGSARIENIELLYEKMEIRNAMKMAKIAEDLEYARDGYAKARMFLPTCKDQTQNRLRKIWNSFPLHAIHFWSRNPKNKLKRYLKKLVNLILDYEAKAGRLPRPHDKKTLKNNEMPLLWRLHVIGQLDDKVHEKLTKMHDVQYKGRRFKLNSQNDFLVHFPDTPTNNERRARKGSRPL